MLKHSHSIVICSRGRPQSVISLVESILACAESSAVKILVVLNGHTGEELSLLVTQYLNQRDQIEIIESTPGLVAARNVALNRIESEVVTFLDDDTLLPENYLVEIDSAFAVDPVLDGLSPRIKGLYSVKNARLKLFERVKPHYGRVTKSGLNYWVPDVHAYEPTPVEWLPGCSMSYRRASIEDMNFSQELMLGPTGGYSLGEDVDFSMQLPKLIAINTISVDHLQAESVRDVSHTMAKARGRWLAYLVRKYPRKVSKFWAILTMVVTCMYFGLRSVPQQRIFALHFVNSFVQLKSFVSELRNPILVRGSNV